MTAHTVMAREGRVFLVKVHMQYLPKLPTVTLAIHCNPSLMADSEPMKQNTQVDGNILKAGGLHSYNKVFLWMCPEALRKAWCIFRKEPDHF